MATRSMTKKSGTLSNQNSDKLTASKDINKLIDNMVDEIDKLADKDKLKFFKKIGIGGDVTTGKYYTCYLCGEPLQRNKFHQSTDPNCKTGVCRICKSCAESLATPIDIETGKKTSPNKESLKVSLEYEDKPFYESLWESSLLEAANQVTGKSKSNVYTSYAKNIAMPQYTSDRYKDGDNMGGSIIKFDNDETELSEDAKETYEINKKTTIRFLGYDPFENESLAEQTLLYAKLVNYFDDSVKDDGLKLEAVIEIVQSFKDVKTINDAISKYKKQLGENPQVISTIKSLADTKQKMITSALALAKDNGISVNYNNNKSKGAGTLSGIIKELSEMDLDEAEINTFDYETNEAISSIMKRNFENQMSQINPDENDWEREVSHQAELLNKLQKERDDAVEYCRLLRKENKDLKEFLTDRGIIDDALNVIDE